MSLAMLGFLIAALLGHTALWISFWNQTQGRSIPVWIMATLSWTATLACVILPLAVVAVCIAPNLDGKVHQYAAYCYTTGCAAFFIIGTPVTWYRRAKRRSEKINVRSEKSSFETVQKARQQSLSHCKSRVVSTLLRCPGNQVFDIESNVKELEIPRLPEALDGLKIAHLSDLHFTGHISKTYFNRAIELVNQSEPDLIAITGDLVDDPKYLSWIPSTIGNLEAELGVFVILGNHDCKTPLVQLRTLLAEVGLVSLSGRTVQCEWNDTPIYLASNELPWLSPTSDVSQIPSREQEPDQLRLLLAHTPDVIHWAQHNDFDLMLAGHTHGGQFRLPGFGPFVCPSRLPLEYASGTIYEPPTQLHVSRGLSGEVPLRLNCRPELTQLVLRSKHPLEKRGTADTAVTLRDHLTASADAKWVGLPAN